MSLGSVPLPNLSKLTESLANLEPCIFAFAFISASRIEPSTIFSDVTKLDVIAPPLNSAPSISNALFLASCAVKFDCSDESLRSLALIVLPLAKFVYVPLALLFYVHKKLLHLAVVQS